VVLLMWCPSCRGLGCSACRPASSLSALVGIVASNQAFQPPICFVPRADYEGLPAKWPSDTAWKASQFPTPEVQ